jgi:hypothetical protein
VLAVSFVTCMMGCGGKNLYPVKGTVVYKDGADTSVLAGGRVIFQPADPEMPNVSPRGQIQKDGSFQMTTPTEGDGVHPGTYKIVVGLPYPPKKSRDELLDPRYLDFETSGLKITVTGPIEDYQLVVEKR